ncbi:MAG: 3-deoxy-7-phosphoheptulonate synthase [Myxococcota bacterium]
MIIVLRPDVRPEEVDAIAREVERHGCRTAPIEGAERSVLAVLGDPGFDPWILHDLSGVARVLRVTQPYKLSSREARRERTIVRVKDVAIGAEQVIVAAGAGAGASGDNAAAVARACQDVGVSLLVLASSSIGGPEGSALPRIADVETIVEVGEFTADIIRVRAHQMANEPLLRACAKAGRPVILERGISATIDEWLLSADTLLAGTPDVILCERGVRTFSRATNNTLDLSALPVLQERTHLPVLVNPTLATGVRAYVTPLALAAVAAGADGVIVEVGSNDSAGGLPAEQLKALVRDLQTIAPVVGRRLDLRTTRPARVRTSVATAEVHCVFQGENGAFSQAAARQVFGPDVTTMGCSSFARTFEAVADGRAPYGIVPVENTLGGSIHECWDLLREFDVQVVGEHKLRVVHNLIANRGSSLDTIEKVYAHPQAAAQCADFLRSHPTWEIYQVYDTAGAAMMIQKEGGTGGAAIAGARVADQLGMDLLALEIESHPENYTRFLVIARTEDVVSVPDSANKATLVFTTADTAGALLEALKVFAAHGVNLTKLESRPIPGRPWEYRFSVDLDGRVTPSLLRQLTPHTSELKLLGIYPGA